MSSRLSGPERRQAVVETACRVFAKGSYRGSTTAQIARETGVTEPVLYRHFASKRELYLACLDAVWERVRVLWDKALEREQDPANWLRRDRQGLPRRARRGRGSCSSTSGSRR